MYGSALPLAAAFFAGGIAIFIYLWFCWSGRNRGWLRSPKWTWLVLGPFSAFGLMLIAMGIGILDEGGPVSRFIVATSMAGGFLGWLIYLFEPSWWGPAWLRKLREAGVDIHADDGSVEHVEDVVPLEQWSATMITRPDGSGDRGTLQLYDDGVLFEYGQSGPASNGRSLPSQAEIPLDEIGAVELWYRFAMGPVGTETPEIMERESPLLSIIDKNDELHLFDFPFVSSAARRIAEVADCKVTERR
jgi:hypothetical protein